MRPLVKLSFGLAILLLSSVDSRGSSLFVVDHYTGTDPFGGSLLENFESNTPVSGWTQSGGWGRLGPANLTDSVEVTNFDMMRGSSFYSFGKYSLTITFQGADLPTQAGIAWTDVGYVDGDQPPTFTGKGDVVFSAIDASNNSLGSITRFLGDGAANGTTGEDTFFGVISANRIKSITISMPKSGDWEVDHLRFSTAAFPVPEPSTMAIAGIALASMGGWRIRRRMKG